MEKALIRTVSTTYYYQGDKRIEGVPPAIIGDLSGIRGNLSSIRGDLSSIRGDLSGIIGDLSGVSGDLSGVRGDLSGVSGDLDDCEITEEERVKGIKIEDLINSV
jgi:hypothetical protein